MPDVVEQRGDLHVTRDVRGQAEPPRHLLRDVKRAERVAKARVLGTGIDEPGKAHLLDAAQPLHRERVDQIGDRAVLALHLDETVYGIAEYPVLHAPGVAR